MARAFVATSNQYLYTSSVPVSAQPLTMACWFLRGAGDSYGMVGIGNSGSDNHYMLGVFFPNNTIFAMTQNTAFPYAESTATITAGVWQHGCAVIAATDSRSAYLNGGNKGTNTGACTNPSGLNQTMIGRRADNYTLYPFNGSIAEVGIWDAALTDAEVAALGKGISPQMVRPQNLAAYWPLISNDNDPVGGFNMSAANTPTFAAHVRQYYRGALFVGAPPAVAAAYVPRHGFILHNDPGMV